MTGIEIAPRRDRHVFRAGAAAGNAFVDARTARQVDHVMVEGERFALALSLDHTVAEKLILHFDRFDILRGKRIRLIRRAHHRLHAQLGESERKHGVDILHEIGIRMGKRAADIVIFAAARFDKTLKLRNDGVPASAPRVIDAQTVVDLAASVKAEHHVRHFAVCKVDHIVVDEHSVRREREAEILFFLLFDAARIHDELLHDIPIHERLAAEEVHLEIPPCSRIFNEKIERAPTDVKAHQRAVAVKFALTCEAVGAVQIAGVGDVKAERFYDIPAFRLEHVRHRLERVLGEQLSLILQSADIRKTFGDITVADTVVFSGERGDDLILSESAARHGYYFIGGIVHGVNGAGTGVKNYVVPVQFVLMYHLITFLSSQTVRGGAEPVRRSENAKNAAVDGGIFSLPKLLARFFG